MKQFTIFHNPILGYQVAKNGWSWPAFFFQWIWAFMKRLWLVGSIVLLAGTALSSVPELWLVGELVISVVMGAYGNKLWVAELRYLEYEQAAVVEAKTPDDALAVHLASHGNEQTLPPEGIVR